MRYPPTPSGGRGAGGDGPAQRTLACPDSESYRPKRRIRRRTRADSGGRRMICPLTDIDIIDELATNQFLSTSLSTKRKRFPRSFLAFRRAQGVSGWWPGISGRRGGGRRMWSPISTFDFNSRLQFQLGNSIHIQDLAIGAPNSQYGTQLGNLKLSFLGAVENEPGH